MTVNEYLHVSFEPHDEYHVRKPVLCADGFKVSIQGGTSFHYCHPRRHCDEYKEVELGYPSMEDDLIIEYAENSAAPTQTVYGWVPIEIVEQLVEKHGGIVSIIDRL